MAKQAREDNAPDPASSYGREKPENEAGMGRLDNNKSTPTHRADDMTQAVKNKQPPRQINADDEGQETGQSAEARRADSGAKGKLPPPENVDHSMMDEEPDGWDQAPTDIKNPRDKRHPRTDGKGGTR